jgi:nucleoside-diphosphate-sugar epimerase
MTYLTNPIFLEDLAEIASAPLPWHQLSGTTILVTGAGGFLPAYMVETLLYLNDHILQTPAKIVAIVRNRARAEERFRAHLHRSDLEISVQDVSAPLDYSGPFHFVIHAASQASPVYYATDPVGTLSANVLGAFHLLTASQAQHDMRGFLYFSSGEVYGNVTHGQKPTAEHDFGITDCTELRACYGESKRMAENMCVSWAHQYKLPTRIARPFHTYGPGMRLDDGRVFADFVRDLLAGGPIVLQSEGVARRTFCYLADATLGFFTVLLVGSDGEAYNVSNPAGECSIAELADRLAAEFSTTVDRRYRPSGSAYVTSTIQSTVPDIRKLEGLGWKPHRGIEDGFRRTVESYGI